MSRIKSIPHKEIDTLLSCQTFTTKDQATDIAYRYGESLSAVEKSTVVVSDLRRGTSRIFHGTFSEILGLNPVTTLETIWETDILSRMSADEQDEKYLAELRFYSFIRRVPPLRRGDYYLAAYLRMKNATGELVDVLHRMFYLYENDTDAIRFGICVYTPMVFPLPAKSIAVNSVSGRWEVLSSENDNAILSPREKQVLTLIEQGFTSRDIAEKLFISKNTVSRHRQEIIAKLQVRNSTEACRRAKQLNIIS